MEDGSKSIKLEVPADVSYILDVIRNAGYEAYIVGGCVRDSLLGRLPKDWDITTSALPEQVKELFHATADTGLKHGTVMVIRGGKGYEVTTYRIDGSYSDGRHPDSVTFTPNLEEDLKRRDFTINAFAYDPSKGIVDLFGGLDDLDNGIIRAVGDPRRRFEEDALRIMRAVRFSAQLSFRIEEETRAAITEFADRLEMVSRERIRVEFENTVYSPNPSYVNEYAGLGLAPYIIPDKWEQCFGEENARIMESIQEAESCDGRILRLAAFFRDIEPEECSSVMRKMTFDNNSRELVCGILKYWKDISSADDLKKVKHMLKVTGDEMFSLAARFAQVCGQDVSASLEAYRLVKERGDAYSISMLDINGGELIAAGIPEGAQIGETLKMLLDKVIEYPELNNKESLLNLLRSNK